MPKYWLLCISLMLFAVVAASQPRARYFLYEDSTLQLSANEALQLFREGAFEPTRKKQVNAGFTRSVYWLAVAIDSTHEPDSLRLLIGNCQINRLEFYKVMADTIRKEYVTGDHFPFDSRPIATAKFAFPLSENSYLYLVRADKHNEAMQLTYRVLTSRELTHQESRSAMITGLLTGIVVLLVIFGFFLGIFTRKKVYLYFILYISVGWLWVFSDLGYAFKYLWPENEWMANRSRPIFSSLTVVFSLRYLVYYVGGLRYRWIRMVFNAIVVLSLIMLGFWFSPWEMDDAPQLGWVLVILIPMVASAYLLFGLVALLTEIWHGNEMARFFLAAQVPLMLLIAANVLNHTGLWDLAGTSLETYGAAVGYVCEIIILTFGQVYAINADRLEKERLQLAYQIQQKENAEALIATQVTERRRIADDLHDIAGSMLSAAKLNVTSAKEQLDAEQHAARQRLAKAEEALTFVSTSVRNLSHALSPIMMQQIGFRRSIQSVVDFYNTSGKIDIELVVIGFEVYQKEMQQLYNVLYSIVYEALNNIAKHAAASKAILQIMEHDDSVNLIIEDDGKGMPASIDKEKSIGLSSMISKINYFNGLIEFDNTGTGLVISIEIPKAHDKAGSVS